MMIKRFVKKDMKRARALDTHVIGITILMAHGSWLMAHGINYIVIKFLLFHAARLYCRYCQ